VISRRQMHVGKTRDRKMQSRGPSFSARAFSGPTFPVPYFRVFNTVTVAAKCRPGPKHTLAASRATATWGVTMSK